MAIAVAIAAGGAFARWRAAAAGLGLAGSLLVASPLHAAPPLERMRLPPGFVAELYAEVADARSLVVVDPLRAVLVGSRGDKIHAIIDGDGDRRTDRVETVLSGLKVANGIAWRDGWLYVAEQHRIVRFAAPDLATLKRASPEVIFAGLPDKSHHGWRYAGFAPDGRLYVAVGAPCNICAVNGLEGTIIRIAPEPGSRPEIFASGVRNSVGFDWQPATGALVFTDNGADWMGDDRPPDELNLAPASGGFFGFPYYGGGRERTREFLGREPPAPVIFPAVAFPAHVAALGVRFYRGAMFPPSWRGSAFVAQHGSWNRTVPDGYRVVRVRFGADHQPAGSEPFAEGFLDGDRPWGRPVDVAELADGSLLISDDYADAVYRISYREP